MSVRNRLETGLLLLLTGSAVACGGRGQSNPVIATETSLAALASTRMPNIKLATATSTESPPLPPPVVERATSTPLPPTATPERFDFEDKDAFAILQVVSLESGLDITTDNLATRVVYPRVEETMVGTTPHSIILQPSETILVPFTTYPYSDNYRPWGTVGVFMDNSTSPVPPAVTSCDVLVYSMGMIAVEPRNPQFEIYKDADIKWGSVRMGALVSVPDEEDRGRHKFGFMQLFNPNKLSCAFTFSVHPINTDEGQQVVRYTGNT